MKLAILVIVFLAACEDKYVPSEYEVTTWDDTWYVSIHRASCVVINTRNSYGSGIAISPYHVLTAGHVVDRDDPNIIFSYRSDRKGAIDCDFEYHDNPCLNHGVKAQHHPGYETGEYHDDLAIITLRWGLHHYRNLDDRPWYPPDEWGEPIGHDIATVFGYGRPDEVDDSRIALRIGPTATTGVDSGEFRKSQDAEYWMPQVPGDSGGGVINTDDELIGIVSHLSNRGGTVEGVAMSVSAYRSWAMAVIEADNQEYDSDGDGVYSYDDGR